MRRPSTPDTRGLETGYLHPGDVVITKEPRLLTTVLGSCVTVTLFARRLRAAAMCHAQFPRADENTPPQSRLYFADACVDYMVSRFLSMGLEIGEMEAKVFGGADVLKSLKRTGKPTIGQTNLAAALEALEGFKLHPSNSDVGGRLLTKKSPWGVVTR